MSAYLTFSSGGVRLAIALHAIREIVTCDAVRRVPHVPPFVRGVVNLRGQVLPVVDVAMRFGRAPTGTGCLIVIDDVGFLVDAVDNVLEWEDDEITPPLSFGLPIDAYAVRGIGRADGAHVMVLDLDRVLTELERAMAVAV